MIKKTLIKKIKSSILLSSLAFGSTIFLVSNFENNNSISKQNIELQDDSQSSSDNSIIKSFTDYTIMANSKDYPPVTTSTGMLGMTSDKKTLAVTTYEGILVWEKKLAEDEQIKEFYKTNYSVNDLTNYQVNNYIYMSVTNVIGVLFGTSDFKNQIFVGLDYNTGVIYEPIKGKDTIVKAKDGLNQLYLNSDNNILGTAGKEFSSYKNTTQTFTMNKNQGVSQIDIKVTDFIGESADDYFIHMVQGGHNVNFAVFIAHDKTGDQGFKVYMVAVDNYLVPVKKDGNSKAIQTIGYYESEKKPDQIDWDEIIRYQPLSVIYGASDIIFTTIVQGKNSKFTKWKYNFGPKTYEEKWSIDFAGKKSINTFVYDYTTQKLFLSYKKSDDGTAIERYNIGSGGSPSPEVLEKNLSNEYYDSAKKEFKNPILVAPVITTQSLANPNPYLIVYPDKNPQGRYFTSGSEVFTTDIVFKRYTDPKQKFLADNVYKQSMPSQISNSKLLGFLSFTSALSGFSSSIQNKQANDDYGTLYYEYSVSYTNWYDKSTKSSIVIPISITGMYAKSQKYSFNFVTGLTGDSVNDEKFKKVQNLISNNFASKLSKKDILDNFFIYDIKGINGEKITLSESNITITPLDSGYSAKISVNVKSNNLPTGLNNVTYTQTYSGFKTVVGYEFGLNQNSDEANSIKANSYASSLTKYDFISYFMTLGNKWNTDLDKWEFTASSNDYTGTVYVTLKYNGTEDDFPATQIDRTLFSSQEISGFKTIPSQFKSTDLKISDYNGTATPSALWNSYKTDPSSSLLSKSISFPYINDNNNLVITALNEETMDDDQYIDLSITLKGNAQTTLPIPTTNSNDNPFFVYKDDNKQYFEDIFPFTGRWNIRNVSHNFEWVTNSGITVPADGDLNIDLNKESYEGINKNMYANEVKEEAIDNLFRSEFYVVEKQIIPNVNKGTLKVIITLKSPQDSRTLNASVNTNNNEGTSTMKIINITHFKVPTPPLLTSVPLIVTVVLAFTFLAITIAVIIYVVARKKYLKLPRSN